METRHEYPQRSDSPSPSVSPTAASSSWTSLERSVSASSSITSFSCLSTSQDGPAPDIASKRRGYTRPQATVFADSARNRDSVMSLGTIAHLQYYFARTGLLDGKGAQLAREDKKEGEGKRTVSGKSEPPAMLSPTNLSFLEPSSSLDSGAVSPLLASPEMSHSSNPSDEPELLTLPPTYSTYKKKELHVPPPPNMSVLRRELREALEDAKKVLESQDSSLDKEQKLTEPNSSPSRTPSTDDSAPTQGWHEIEGLHILDLVTLAIRAAKNYYTSHDSPKRLNSICPERQIRTDLYRVMEVLKRVGSRNFAGGYRPKETEEILTWISKIEKLVNKDEKAEQKEQAKREEWMWLNGNCAGHEREREWVFFKSFEPDTSIPVWTEPSDEEKRPTPFLHALRDGITLVKLHNELVKNSWRTWGDIKTWHTDTNKPYRCMENLRYWVKAAQLRWDIQLDVDVSGVVNDRSFDAWRGFDAAILKWSRAVREQMTAEWKEHRASSLEKPVVQVEHGVQTGREAQAV